MTPHLADTPVIETERLTLRAPRMGDYPAWEAFFASDRARFIGGPGETRTAWRGFAHVVGMWALKGCGSFVFTRKRDDTPLGMAGPWVPEDWPEREIGWTVWDADAEGKGYAFEAAAAARDHAFRDLGWSTAVSYITAGNDRSVALAERLGARLDASAEAPGDDSEQVLVYRHPAPEGPQ
ncbi:MAG: GNAT family N-acetyltransferase [Paracoccaceae bacterium]|nr:GNAT family N-acetyltransferase [Paracoccaceae bacterium]